MADDMEQRLVALINSTERLLVRFTEARFDTVEAGLSAVEGELRDLRAEHALTRGLVLALPGALKEAMLPRLTAIENRLAALERKP